MLSNTSLKDFGYYYLSPLLAHYFRAVTRRLDQKTRPVCLAREGYLFRKVLLALETEGFLCLPNDPLYLQVSRVVLHKALLCEADFLGTLLTAKFQGSFARLLTGRFGLNAMTVDDAVPAWERNCELNLPTDADVASTLILRHLDSFVPEAKATREGLGQYFLQCGLRSAEEGDRLLLLDLGYSGTIQRLLTHLLARDTEGLYVMASAPGRHRIGKNWASMDGALGGGHEIGSGFIPLDRSLFYECLLTAPHGQVLDVLLDGKNHCHFVYGGQAAGQRYWHELAVIHEGAIEGIIDCFRNGVEWTEKELTAMAEVNLSKALAIPHSLRLLFSTDDCISGNVTISPLQLCCM
jgi:hypothetical protein